MLNWKQPNLEQLDYWEAEGAGGFWITSRGFYSTSTGKSRKRWVLCGGDLELGVYDSLAEAKLDAEPEYTKGWAEDSEQERPTGVDRFHRYLQEEP